MNQASVSLAVPDRLQTVDAARIRVGGEIGRRIDITIHNNLMQLDLESFLAPFRTRGAKISTYIGLGKVLDSAVRFAAHTGDAQVRERKEYIAAELLKTQDAEGYIGYFPPNLRLWYVWDVHEMSYVVLGLTGDYIHFGNEASLNGARRLMDYILSRWQAEPNREIGGEHLSYWLVATGFEQAILTLYRATGDRRYLDFCIQERRLAQWDEPIAVGRHGRVEGHVYAYLARCLAQQELYRLQGDSSLLGPSRRVIDFVAHQGGMVVSGACGQAECWRNDQDGSFRLAETCATAHLIYFLDSLLRLEANPYYGDLMERIIYNALFAAQSPNGRKIRYFTPTEGERTYFERDGYCCPGNYRRIISDLPRMIYYQTDGGLVVNLFTESTLSTEVAPGLTVSLEQKTDYPASGDVTLRLGLSRPHRFPLQIRIPRWCPEAHLTINNGAFALQARGGSFCPLEKEWASGDTVQITMPMPWRVIRGRKCQTGRGAVMRGPVVFAFDPSAHEALAGLPLARLAIDPASLAGPERSDRVRPDGVACRAKAWSPKRSTDLSPDLEIVLTEFLDPGARLTHFYLPNPEDAVLVDDELLEG